MDQLELQRTAGRYAVIGMVALFIAVVPGSGSTPSPRPAGVVGAPSGTERGSENGSGSWPADQDPDTVSLTDAPLPPRSDVAEVSLTCTNCASPGF